MAGYSYYGQRELQNEWGEFKDIRGEFLSCQLSKMAVVPMYKTNRESIESFMLGIDGAS